MTKDRVDKPGDQKADDQIRSEPDSLGNRTRDDRRRRATENQLKHEKRQHPRSGIITDAEVGTPDQSPVTGTKHQRESETPVGDGGDAEVDQVLDRDVGAVFGAGQAAFQKTEASLHGHDKCGAHQHPGDVAQFVRGVHGLAPDSNRNDAQRSQCARVDLGGVGWEIAPSEHTAGAAKHQLSHPEDRSQNAARRGKFRRIRLTPSQRQKVALSLRRQDSRSCHRRESQSRAVRANEVNRAFGYPVDGATGLLPLSYFFTSYTASESMSRRYRRPPQTTGCDQAGRLLRFLGSNRPFSSYPFVVAMHKATGPFSLRRYR